MKAKKQQQLANILWAIVDDFDMNCNPKHEEIIYNNWRRDYIKVIYNKAKETFRKEASPLFDLEMAVVHFELYNI